MKLRLVLLELSAILVLPGFAIAQAATLPDGSTDPSITCAPLARTPARPGSNYESTSSMSEMCTAADPWKSKMIGVNNDQNKLVGSADAGRAHR